jgi:DNA-binding response OmpR family regulator
MGWLSEHHRVRRGRHEVAFPMRPAPDREIAPRYTFSMAIGELLVVDDDEDVAEALTDVLAAEGYRVRVARDGQQGLDALNVGYPDLVLLDVEMPVMSGPAMAYRMFLEDVGRENIPIVLLAGVADLPGIAANVGTPYFLEKPYALDRLLTLLSLALRERRAPIRH